MNTNSTPERRGEGTINFIQWMGDNHYEIESFCGRSLEEDDVCPDILLIPCGFKMHTVCCDLGMYIIKDAEGWLSVVKDWKDFRKTNN